MNVLPKRFCRLGKTHNPRRFLISGDYDYIALLGLDGFLLVGFGSGGSTYGQTSERFGGGGGAGVKIDPVAFLIIKDGQTRMVPVSVPAVATVDRVLEMAPPLIDRVEGFVAKKKEEKEFV